MKDAQKKLILWALVIFAVLFHVLFCEWQVFDWKYGDDKGATIARFCRGIYLYAHAPAPANSLIFSLNAKAEHDEESNLLAISLGIIIPLLLLTARIYLQLGWFNTIFVGNWLKRAGNWLKS